MNVPEKKYYFRYINFSDEAKSLFFKVLWNNDEHSSRSFIFLVKKNDY
jgi:hypothetical protein